MTGAIVPVAYTGQRQLLRAGRFGRRPRPCRTRSARCTSRSVRRSDAARPRRVLRIVGRVVLCTVAIVALVVGASWSLLQTKRGGEALRRFALPRVNAMLAGRVAVGAAVASAAIA